MSIFCIDRQGVWKCYFPRLKTEKQTDRPADGHEGSEESYTTNKHDISINQLGETLAKLRSCISIYLFKKSIATVLAITTRLTNLTKNHSNPLYRLHIRWGQGGKESPPSFLHLLRSILFSCLAYAARHFERNENNF